MAFNQRTSAETAPPSGRPLGQRVYKNSFTVRVPIEDCEIRRYAKVRSMLAK
jgi:hypothetical protein